MLLAALPEPGVLYDYYLAASSSLAPLAMSDHMLGSPTDDGALNAGFEEDLTLVTHIFKSQRFSTGSCSPCQIIAGG